MKIEKYFVQHRHVPNSSEKYIGLAFFVSSFSKDPATRMGAVIVDENNFPKGYGYNGPPRKIKDYEVDWSRPAKYDWIIHAEINAISHSFGDLKNSTIYVTGKPCKRCMLDIVNSGISRVVYFPFQSKYKNSMFSNGEINETTDEIAKLGGVIMEKFNGNLNWMKDYISDMKELGVF